MVQAIGVVPHDAEILRCRAQGGQAAHRVVGIGDAVGIGVHGHTPDALDQRILYQAFHRVHVGAGFGHLHGDELQAKILRHGKVPVITGSRAEEFHRALENPGLMAADALGIGAGDIIEHEIEAGIAAHDDVGGFHPQNVAEQGFDLGNPVEQAIVAGIHPAGGFIPFPLVDAFEHVQGEIQLLGAGLAAGHIQLQAPGLIGVILFLQLRRPGAQLGLGQFFQRFHENMLLSDCIVISKLSFILVYAKEFCKLILSILQSLAFSLESVEERGISSAPC